MYSQALLALRSRSLARQSCDGGESQEKAAIHFQISLGQAAMSRSLGRRHLSECLTGVLYDETLSDSSLARTIGHECDVVAIRDGPTCKTPPPTGRPDAASRLIQVAGQGVWLAIFANCIATRVLG